MGGFGSGGDFPLTAALMPIHPLAFGAFMSWQLLSYILGHAGFEIYPNWLVESPFRWVFNTPTKQFAQLCQQYSGNSLDGFCKYNSHETKARLIR